MAYKFQRGEAILSGALLQEGDVEIESGFNFKMHDETILDTSRNLTVADMSGSGKLEVGGTVQLDGVVDAALDVAADSVYFLDSDGKMKRESFADLMSSAVTGDNGLGATDGVLSIQLHGDGGIEQASDALKIKAGGVTNDMLAGSIVNAKLVNDSVTVTAGAALSGGGEVDLGASINLDVEVDDSSIEVSGDALQVKALGITNDMLAGSIASSKIAELNNFDTADLAEGSNLYYTDARSRAAISVTDNGGDGALAYDSSTGEISFTGPSAAEVRAHFSAGYMIDLDAGEFAIDASEFSGSWDAVLATKDTDDLDEGSSHLYFTEARARASVSVTDAGGDGSLAYDSSTGVITYTGPSAAEVRAHLSVADSDSLDMAFSEGQISADVLVDDSSIEVDSSDGLRVKALGITNAMLAGSIASTKIAELNNFDTEDLAEGSNLYFTDAQPFLQ